MSGQTPTQPEELQDELVVLDFSADPGTTATHVLGIARRRMFLENAKIRFEALNGAALNARLVKVADGQTTLTTNTHLTGLTPVDDATATSTTAGTAYDMTVEPTSNEVLAGELVCLAFENDSGVSTAPQAALGVVTLSAQFTTRAH